MALNPLAALSTAEVRAGDWQLAYRRVLWLSDLAVVIVAVFLSQYIWFSATGERVTRAVDDTAFTYTWLSVALIVGWQIALAISGSRGARVVGMGMAEYRLVISSAVHLFAIVAVASYLTMTPVSRGYILFGFPLGLAALLLTRYLWRQRLKTHRRAGRGMARALVIGDDEENSRITAELDRAPEAGYLVVGLGGPGSRTDYTCRGVGVPFLGPADDVIMMMSMVDADTLIVASDAALPVRKVKEISWRLEAGRQHLILVPSLTDIGGPRLHTRPVAGLPLVHVETPRYTGRQRLVKRTFDIIGSVLLLMVLAPLFAILGTLVRASGSGPVFYRQERIGQDGRPFQLIKFRTMVPDADDLLPELLAEQGKGGAPLFKLEQDPRITPVGRVLRKHSLDEFPQLLNVLFGDMSLVGPRPQRSGEVAFYDFAAERRLIVKPGMSGLWQVSGRSALSWEEALRLDLYYVENWSLLGDIGILFRTFRAVLAPGDTAH